MGNYVCCLTSKVPANVLKVIALNGNVQEFDSAIKAADLMLENPQHFVCHSTALQTGRRISALAADEDLELGQLYFLLPMKKLQSSPSPSEIASLASLALKADSAFQKSTSNYRSLTRILPVFGDLCQLPAGRKLAAMNGRDELNEEINGAEETTETKDTVMTKLQVGNADGVGEMTELSMRISRYKYWKPALETINESPSLVKKD